MGVVSPPSLRSSLPLLTKFITTDLDERSKRVRYGWHLWFVLIAFFGGNFAVVVVDFRVVAQNVVV
jgi:hypothetical protein